MMIFLQMQPNNSYSIRIFSRLYHLLYWVRPRIHIFKSLLLHDNADKYMDLTTEYTDSFTTVVTIDANDMSCKVSGGLQHIMTPDPYVYTLDAKNGFPCIFKCQIGQRIFPI